MVSSSSSHVPVVTFVVLATLAGVVLSDTACGFTGAGGFTYDLTFFQNLGTVTTTDTKNQGYQLGFCHLLPADTTPVRCKNPTYACQSYLTSGYKNMGTTQAIGALAAGPDKGVTISNTNGQMGGTSCSQAKVSSYVDLVCDKTVTGAFVLNFVKEDTTKCAYYFSGSHANACPVGNGGQPGSDTSTSQTGTNNGGGKKGLSGGSIMMLIILITSVVYFSVGAVYQLKVKGASGADLIIHRSFWASIPGLALDGCRFTMSKIRGGGSYSSLK